MKKLVIGGSGFVGSVLVDKLIKLGHEVIVFDNLRFGYEKNIENLNVEFLKGDIQNPKILENYIEQVDVIYFLATVNIIAAENDYSDCIQTNVVGLNKILELTKNKSNIKRFVYTSTSSIYGNGVEIQENTNKEFLNIYATTKYQGECLCKLYQNTENLPLTIIRYTNIYGRNQRPESPFCGVVSRFIEKSIKGEDIEITGDGNQIRDFLSVEDATELTIRLSLLDSTLGDDINLNTGNGHNIRDLAELIKKLTNSNSKIISISERKIDNIKCRRLKNDKLKSFIDYKFLDIEEGIIQTINWYKNNYKI